MHLLLIGTLSGPLGQAAKSLRERGAQVHHADNGDAAMVTLRAHADVSHVLFDVSFDVAAFRASLFGDNLKVILLACTTALRPGLGRSVMHSGSDDLLELPLSRDTLDGLFAAHEGAHSQPIAADPLTLGLLHQAAKVAASEASVLILGESGTGKEVFARHIHRHSRRAAGPFVAINCAAIPDTLLESELFGYEKGAFSGAVARRIGKFEAAQRGTLLLDEIGEIDIRLQAKLLRAIQEREIDRVGGTGPIKIDVRILATTNRDLTEGIKTGAFREDLYYRINVINLQLPPLRRRPDDIMALANSFARKYARLNGLDDRFFDDGSQHRLQSHLWPGNVRELENAVHRSVLTSVGQTLQFSVGTGSLAQPAARAAAGVDERTGGGLRGFVGNRLDDLERALILETLEHTNGNRTHAATMLGISIRALRNRIREYATMGVAVPTPQNHAA